MPANILNPLVAMMVLTFVVWVFMYVRPRVRHQTAVFDHLPTAPLI